jgi:excisionase family DNA binding protein
MAHAHIPVVPLTNRRAYSLAEVAAVTGFSLSFIYELIKKGALRSRKVAGRRIVTVEALAELLGEGSSTLPTPAIVPEQPNAHASAGREPPGGPHRVQRKGRTGAEVRHPSPACTATTPPSQAPERGGAR